MENKDDEFLGKIIEGLDSKDYEKALEASKSAGASWLASFNGYKQAGWTEAQAFKLVLVQITEFWRAIYGGGK